MEKPENQNGQFFLHKTEQSKKARYRQSAENKTVMAIKDKIIVICAKIMDILNNVRLTRFLKKFYDLCESNDQKIAKFMQLSI
jgi:hypothetical protein